MAKEMYLPPIMQVECWTNCPVSSERDLKRKGGTMEKFRDSSMELFAVSWCNNRLVLTILNIIRTKAIENCYDKKQK